MSSTFVKLLYFIITFYRCFGIFLMFKNVSFFQSQHLKYTAHLVHCIHSVATFLPKIYTSRGKVHLCL